MNPQDNIDWSPLIALEHLHGNRYGAIKLLEVLFNGFDGLLPNAQRNTQFQGRAYVEVMLVELTCQYVEDVACYSLACKETGCLYIQRVLSVGPEEIGKFYSNLDQLTNEDIGNIFGIHGEQACGVDYSTAREKYRRLRQFRSEYHGFHNAVKHGWRFRISEFSNRDNPMNSMHGTNVDFGWIEVGRLEKQAARARAWDGSEVEVPIRRLKQAGVQLPSDDISVFVDIAENCHTIIEDILRAHAPSA